MNPERWQRIDELFQAAVELDIDSRAAFLDQNCAGDQALRGEVEALLTSDANEWTFIDGSALGLAASIVVDDRPRLTAGDKIAHYEIVRLIGKGGMGEVYLAKDLTLNRNLALKLLPSDYTGDSDRLRRFQQEAHAASALNHPNILTIYELGMVDEQPFIATEFVAGETLRQRMSQQRLSVHEALDITIQTAGALLAAHQAGIIHRDIKPENIMLRPDGYVKVLDFGLAKLTEYRDPEPTAELPDRLDLSSGLVMGTVKYMSPEQAQGLPVDPRSDIFSLGAVLYEMVVGDAPFHGETAAEVIKSILKDEPASVAEVNPGVPEELIAIIQRALSKKKERRYQTTENFLADLKDLKEEIGLENRRRDSRSPGEAALARSSSVGARVGPATSPSNQARSTTAIANSLIERVRGNRLAAAFGLIALVMAVVGLVWFSALRRVRSPARWVTRTSMPTPVISAAGVGFNGKFYVFDGAYPNSISAPEMYDPISDSWSLKTPDPTVRAASVAGVIDGKIYVAEGCLNSDSNTPTNALEIFDPANDSWTAGASSLIARGTSASGVIGNKLYVAGGGKRGGHVKFADLEIYDSRANKWSTGAPMPMAIEHVAGVAIDEKFYVFGGDYGPTNTNNTISNLLFIYDPATDSWSRGAPMLTPRTNLAAGVLNGKIYAVGGSDGAKLLATVEIYDPASNRWSEGPAAPTARELHVLGVIDSTIYVTGGHASASTRIIGNLDVLNQESSPAFVANRTPGSPCSPPPAGLVGWWPGDGNANDITGSNNGIGQGEIRFAGGKVGQAFSFDGTSFVTMGNPVALNLTGTQVTIDGWIKPNINASAVYFGKTEYCCNDYVLSFGRGLHGLIKSGGIGMDVIGYRDIPTNTNAFVPPVNEWTHVALSYDGSIIRLYANGDLVGEESASGNIEGDDVPFNIGGRAVDNGTGKFNGLIDEVEVFNRALSASEIMSIYQAGANGICKPPRH